MVTSTPLAVNVDVPPPMLPKTRPAPAHWLQCVSRLDPRFGGVSAAVPQLASRLALEQAVRIDLAAFAAEDETATLAGRPEIAPHHWTASRASWLMQRRLHGELDRLMRPVDGVHIHGLWETHGAVCAAAARRHGKPYIVSAHGMLEPWALAQRAMKKRVYAALLERSNLRHAACAHALTAAEVEDYRRFGFRGPVAVIPNAVDRPPQVDVSLLPETFPGIRYRRTVLFLGRLHPKKGVELLLRAWALLAHAHSDTVLVLAGPAEDSYRAQLAQMAAEARIGDRVVFTGMLDHDLKWSALAWAECFVLPSFSEGQSVAVLEALAMSVPVILTRQCHMPEIADCGAGLEIEPSLDELTSTLDLLLHSRGADTSAMGARGRDLVEQRFRWAVVAARMAELYRWVASGMPHGEQPGEVYA